MSIEASRAIRRGAAAVLGSALAISAATAAEVDFRPVLSFGLFHTGNAQIVGTEAVSDDVAALAFDLGVERRTATSTFQFRYQPSYAWYRILRDLDYFGNSLGLRYSLETSRKARLQASVDGTRTDYQGITAATADRPSTFVPRTTLTRVYGAVGGSVSAARRGLADWEVRAGFDRYDPLPGVVFNDDTAVGARGGWRYELTDRSTLGVAAQLGWIGYSASPDTVTESLYLTGTHRLGRYTDVGYDVGATRATEAGHSDTGSSFLLAFRRELTELIQLSAGARRLVTPGTGIQGATRDAGAWVSYLQTTRRSGLGGSIDGAYWIRKGLGGSDVDTTETRTLDLAGSLTWTFNRYLALNFGYAFVDQRIPSGSTCPFGSPAPNAETSACQAHYGSYGVYLRYGIRGLEGTTPFRPTISVGR